MGPCATLSGVLAAWLVALAFALGLSVASDALAVALLALYYFAAPPWVGYTYAMPAEGSYLVVNKIVVEAAARSGSSSSGSAGRCIWCGRGGGGENQELTIEN